MALESLNPTTGELIARYDETTTSEVASIVEDCHSAHIRWRETEFGQRSQLLLSLAGELTSQADSLARLITDEMGKSIRESRAEVEKCAWVCEYYAEEGERHLRDMPVATEAASSYVTFQPLGVVLAVMPWNFPFWQVFRFLAPALMAGNGGVLKHASNVSGCALAIERLVHEAGFPEALFRTLIIPSPRVEGVIANPHVAAVTLTGSTAAGMAVGALSGRSLKKSVLELGGSDPYLILHDADVDSAAEICAAARLLNAGQSCIAAKRFVVEESVREEFEAKLLERMSARVMGDPTRPDVDIGPQARTDLRDELHSQVVRSIGMGARLLLGGSIPEGPGAFYPPTVLTDVRPGMAAYDEEVFGPVAAIIPVDDEVEAIAVANDSTFGLGAAVFSRDVARAERIAKCELEAGCCFVNAFVKSDPRLPFGGIKQSGYGRELSVMGIREFVNAKTVYVA
jgi:succinate-semialdehyde dehydrogenase/glutarate-semialdehyde dehydrogenase